MINTFDKAQSISCLQGAIWEGKIVMGYKYETHLHTSEASLCGSSTGAELARFYKEQGYQGLVVTDHFFNGNTAVDRSLPWEEKVALYCRGYESAKEEGDKIGLDVFFGVEWAFHGDEFLLYGVSKEWLLAHPDMLGWSHKQLFEEIEKIGGLMIQAHPFRDRGYIGIIHLYPELVHGIEVTNTGNAPMDDRLADVYAKYWNLPVTSGSDTHRVGLPGRGIRGVVSEERWVDITSYANQVKNHTGYEIISTEDAVGIQPEDRIHKAVDMFDREEKDITERLHKILPESVFLPEE